MKYQIKSHDIVRKGKNRTLNTSMNNLKFYKFKQRLLFKSIEKGKKVDEEPEDEEPEDEEPEGEEDEELRVRKMKTVKSKSVKTPGYEN